MSRKGCLGFEALVAQPNKAISTRKRPRESVRVRVADFSIASRLEDFHGRQSIVCG